MIFQHTWQAVLNGTKTQTRRLVKPPPTKVGYFTCDAHLIAFHWEEERPFPGEGVYIMDGHTGSNDVHGPTEPEYWYRAKWIVGRTYAVQPGRGKRAIARIRITGIRRQDVREITHEDAVAEGFPMKPVRPKRAFLELWCSMHDREMTEKLLGCEHDLNALNHTPLFLYAQPAHRYDAWVLEFELVKEAS